MTLYCTEDDVYSIQPAGSFSNPGRIVASVRESLFELDSHGLSFNSPVTFEGESVPPPIERGRVYYALPMGPSWFAVCEEHDGDSLIVESWSQPFAAVRVLPWLQWIEWASSLVDEFIPHVLPLSNPIPSIVRHTTANLVAQRALQFCGGTDIDINAHIQQAQQMLSRWEKSVPVRGADRPRTTSMGAITGAPLPRVDVRGWKRYAI